MYLFVYALSHSGGGGGGLLFDTGRDARRLALGCKFRIFGLRVSGCSGLTSWYFSLV